MTLLNKKNKSPVRSPKTKLTAEEQFWKEVEERSQDLIARLLEKTLPLDASSKNLNLAKDLDYRLLLNDDLPAYYADNEEYQEKMSNQSWNEADVEYVSQDLVCAYFDLVVQALTDQLSEYPAFATTSLTNLKGI